MLKNILKLSVIGFLVVSCSGDDQQIEDLKPAETVVINDQDITNLELKISADKTQGNIFESFVFQLSQKNSNWYFSNLDEHLDSLVFKMAETQETKKIFDKKSNGNSGISKFGHHFYLPGNYTAGILGYKNGNIIYKNQVSLKVTNSNDFLAINWNNFQASNDSTGYHNSLLKNHLSLYSSFENNYPYVIMRNSWDNFSDYTSDQISQKDKEYLYSYINQIYSAPQYSEANTSNLKNVYLQNFKKSINNDVPVSIWITAKNKIALIKEYSKTNPAQFYGYRIIAEPNI